MWVIAIILTVILWLLLDNILIAAILAIFVVYMYSLLRALYSAKKGQMIEGSLIESQQTQLTHEQPQTIVANAEGRQPYSQGNQVDSSSESEQVDSSYIDYVEGKFD
ncbi:hypothetical protein HMPREF3144_04725 [Oligella sp. HMSC05A10]|uniref:hypothetical protein n=1 Tax=Oligella sp. HMSC05A10 TaxID=1581112 RepID=UPI0008A4EC07|nr:hypothetical protein [Oligella sp. HMSC05A10]OFS86160.1 hypothetical protein HMPREF3144_04725 [Oligella sp. HMSC05A10]